MSSSTARLISYTIASLPPFCVDLTASFAFFFCCHRFSLSFFLFLKHFFFLFLSLHFSPRCLCVHSVHHWIVQLIASRAQHRRSFHFFFPLLLLLASFWVQSNANENGDFFFFLSAISEKCHLFSSISVFLPVPKITMCFFFFFCVCMCVCQCKSDDLRWYLYRRYATKKHQPCQKGRNKRRRCWTY